MSTLLFEEAFTGKIFKQNIRLLKTINLSSIRVHTYKEGFLSDGDFKCSILQNDIELTSTTVSFQEINDNITSTYAHGFMAFLFSDGVRLAVKPEDQFAEYTIQLEALNHTNDPNNFIAFIKDFDNKFITTYGQGVNSSGPMDPSNEPQNDAVEPYGIEIYTWERT